MILYERHLTTLGTFAWRWPLKGGANLHVLDYKTMLNGSWSYTLLFFTLYYFASAYASTLAFTPLQLALLSSDSASRRSRVIRLKNKKKKKKKKKKKMKNPGGY